MGMLLSRSEQRWGTVLPRSACCGFLPPTSAVASVHVPRAGRGTQLTWIQVNTCSVVADLEKLSGFAQDLALWPANELGIKSISKQSCSAGYVHVGTYMGWGTSHLPGMQNAVFGGCRHPSCISLATSKLGGRIRPVKGKTPLLIARHKCILSLHQFLYRYPWVLLGAVCKGPGSAEENQYKLQWLRLSADPLCTAVL